MICYLCDFLIFYIWHDIVEHNFDEDSMCEHHRIRILTKSAYSNHKCYEILIQVRNVTHIGKRKEKQTYFPNFKSKHGISNAIRKSFIKQG